MLESKLKTEIKRSREDVFEFTTNSNNTHLWMSETEAERSTEYPIVVGAFLESKGFDSNIWSRYKIIEYIEGEILTLTDLNGYFVKYSYSSLDNQTTEITCIEWRHDDKSLNPLTQEPFLILKEIMER